MRRENYEGYVEQEIRQQERWTRLGWRQERVLGQGAFARVFLVREIKGGRMLACKVAETEQGMRILIREAAILRSLEHPLFAKYADFVREKDRALLFMEYVEGECLSRILERRGALPSEDAVRIAAGLAEGLCYLHERPCPLLYRDLKPDNICVRPDGSIKLLDLGCACTMDEARHSRAGSRGYAAPEQLGSSAGESAASGSIAADSGETGGTRLPGCHSDVYALGWLLSYMLTGQDPCQPPFCRHPIRVCGLRISPLLERTVEQCTEEEPAKRPPDMRAVLRQLKPFLDAGSGVGLWLREQGALLQWFFSGRRWETDFLYEKSVRCHTGPRLNA